MARLAWITGRCLMALLFLGGAAQKVADPGAVMGLLADKGLAEWLIWPALVFNAVAGVALIAGWWLRPWGLRLRVIASLPVGFTFYLTTPGR